eukprot:CAMPEP_0184973120 /NCGR_PEP_ID=MMETSP1098-20130426/5014_1 /TAXON_ID=89044 /ORGANISM="Spumella elongata, Strain CCAP 955/1" /LENGTH=515 /DNA_ID=CAMNT_0027495551 /DNA_START=241 /DNA_END=1788 /DNA_ORIENTATION=-
MEGFVGGKTSSEIAANREPLVVTHSLASLWPALNWNLRNFSQTSWTTLYDVLSTPVPVARLCSQVDRDTSMPARESVFYMHDKGHSSGSIKNSATGSTAKPPKHIHEMSLQSFLDVSDALLQLRNVTDTSKLRRYLYSTDYDELEAELNLQRDTSWRDFLINDFDCGPNSKSGAPCENEVIPSPVFTMLHPGSVLQARYSEYHTMRVQLQGRATYYLFPPHSSNFPLHVYPSVHRCARQAQINLYEEGGQDPSVCPAGSSPNKRSSLFQTSEKKDSPAPPPAVVQKVVLEPGEVLYIPPYWFMHSEALALSVSLDVLSVSQEQLLLLPAEHMGLPFQEADVATKEQRFVSAQVFLVHVLSRIKGFKSVRKYAESLYDSRYAALYPESGLFIQRSNFQCLRDNTKLYNRIVRKLLPESIEKAAAFVAQRLNDPLLHSSLQMYDDNEADNEPRPNPQRGVRWLWLGNYIEQIARWAMGDPEEVVLFIRECLNMDTVLEVIEEVEGPGAVKMEPQEDQ